MKINKEGNHRKNNSYSAGDYIARLRSSVSTSPEIDMTYFNKLLCLPSPLKEQAVVAYLLDLGKCAEITAAENINQEGSENKASSNAGL